MPVNVSPVECLGSFHVHDAWPEELVEECVVPSLLPFSLPRQDSVPLTPLPVVLLVTVNETVNDEPAFALPKLADVDASLGGFGFGRRRRRRSSRHDDVPARRRRRPGIVRDRHRHMKRPRRRIQMTHRRADAVVLSPKFHA